MVSLWANSFSNGYHYHCKGIITQNVQYFILCIGSGYLFGKSRLQGAHGFCFSDQIANAHSLCVCVCVDVGGWGRRGEVWKVVRSGMGKMC